MYVIKVNKRYKDVIVKSVVKKRASMQIKQK